jgi:hypothetical protein
MIFRLVWPYLQRRLAKQAAEYLQKRRERRFQVHNDIASTVTSLAEQAQETASRSAAVNAVWFTLSGILLGSAIGLIVAQIFLRED